MLVWGRRNSVNVQKVMWTIGELGISFKRYDVGGSFGTDNQYAIINPQKTVPTIQDGEITLWESNACVRYLCEHHGDKLLWPKDPKLRALSDQWMDTRPMFFLPLFYQYLLTKLSSPQMNKTPSRRLPAL